MSEFELTFRRDPEDFFFIPGLHEGLSFIAPPDWLWRWRKEHKITLINKCSDEEESERLEKEIAKYKVEFNKGYIEYNIIPSLVRNAAFYKTAIASNKRWVLTGSAGIRLRRAYYLFEKSNERHKKMSEYLSALTRNDSGGKIDITSDVPPDAPICLDVRNFTNFYHFISETVACFPTIQKLGDARKILLHSSNLNKQKFVQSFIEEFFPDLLPRIKFINDMKGATYECCLTIFETDHLFYMMPEESWYQGDLDSIPNELRCKGRPTIGELNRMSFTQSYVKINTLREHCIEKISNVNVEARNFPKKILISRKNDMSAARSREPERWAELKRELLQAGFEEVFYETLSPSEQVAISYFAEVIVLAHGAGVMNMLFAGKNTKVIEIGNIGSTGGRLAAFARLARASGCNYNVVYADRAPLAGGTKGSFAAIKLNNSAIDEIVRLGTE